MIHVSYADVAAMYPKLADEADEEYVETLIDKATRLLYTLVPSIDARVGAGYLNEGLVVDKIVEAVLRVIRNPDAKYQSETELGYSYTLNKRLASGDLWYPDTDLALLSPKKRRYGTIALGSPCGWARP